MHDEMKRRVFLATIAGTFIGVPVAVRLLTGQKRETADSHRYTKELKQYRSLLDVPVLGLQDQSTVALPLSPPIGERRRYVIFAPSYFPNNLSRAVGNDPDTFVVRDGEIFIDRLSNGQVVITGGDSLFHVSSPMGNEVRENSQVMILFKEGQLRLAKQKGVSSEHAVDVQLPHLLSLQNPPKGNLSLGQRWKGAPGRLRPFAGYVTNYEVQGLADIAGRKTVNIAFSGETPNVVGMPDVNSQKPGKNETMVSKHHGNAWFDLETGLLIRQETHAETTTGGLDYLGAKRGTKADGKVKDEPYSLTVKSELIVQLFTA